MVLSLEKRDSTFLEISDHVEVSINEEKIMEEAHVCICLPIKFTRKWNGY